MAKIVGNTRQGYRMPVTRVAGRRGPGVSIPGIAQRTALASNPRPSLLATAALLLVPFLLGVGVLTLIHAFDPAPLSTLAYRVMVWSAVYTAVLRITRPYSARLLQAITARRAA